MVLKTIVKIFKIIWIFIGVLVFYWTGYWYYKMHTINNLAVVVVAFLFASGIYMLAIYLPLTVLLIIIYLILKKKKKI